MPAHLPPARVNPEQIRIVLRNLLDNAVAYTPRGGWVELRAAPLDGRPELLISVADSGVGIPAEALPRVFDRFFRVDAARSRRNRGTGLGLALVQRLVTAHGGRVEVASGPGKGSTFSVYLPTERDGADSTPACTESTLG